MHPKSKRSDSDQNDLISTVVTTATKILAPNSLQFDDNEFERWVVTKFRYWKWMMLTNVVFVDT